MQLYFKWEKKNYKQKIHLYFYNYLYSYKFPLYGFELLSSFSFQPERLPLEFLVCQVS